MDAISLDSMSDEELYSEFQAATLNLTASHGLTRPSQGHHKARSADELHRRYNRLVLWTLSRRFSLPRHEAEEVAQEAWTAVFSWPKQARSFSGLLFTVSRRRALNWKRQAKCRIGSHSFFSSDGDLDESSAGHAEDSHIECVVARDAVRNALAQLDETDRQIAISVLVDDCTRVSTAARHGLSVGQLECRLSRITRQLRRMLA